MTVWSGQSSLNFAVGPDTRKGPDTREGCHYIATLKIYLD